MKITFIILGLIFISKNSFASYTKKIHTQSLNKINNMLESDSRYYYSDNTFKTKNGDLIVLKMKLICDKKSSVLRDPIDGGMKQNCYIRPVPYLRVNRGLVSADGLAERYSDKDVGSSNLLSGLSSIEIKNYCFLEGNYSDSTRFFSEKSYSEFSDKFINTLNLCARDTFSTARHLRTKNENQDVVNKIKENSKIEFDEEKIEMESMINRINKALSEVTYSTFDSQTNYPKLFQTISLKLSCGKIKDKKAHCWFKTIDSTKFAKERMIVIPKSLKSLLADVGYTRMQAKCYLKSQIKATDIIELGIIWDELKPSISEDLKTCAVSLFESMNSVRYVHENHE